MMITQGIELQHEGPARSAAAAVAVSDDHGQDTRERDLLSKISIIRRHTSLERIRMYAKVLAKTYEKESFALFLDSQESLEKDVAEIENSLEQEF